MSANWQNQRHGCHVSWV